MHYILYSYNTEARQKKCYRENHKQNTFTVLYLFLKNPHVSGPTQLKPIVQVSVVIGKWAESMYQYIYANCEILLTTYLNVPYCSSSFLFVLKTWKNVYVKLLGE